MPKKRITKKQLLKGRFYIVHDGSKSGHPGMIYWKNDNKNMYLSLTTGTTYNKDLITLSHPTDDSTKTSFVYQRPFLGKRKDYGNKILIGMRFHKKDKKIILHSVSIKEPRYSTNIGRKEKRYLKVNVVI